MPSSAYFNYSYWEPRTFLVPLGEKEIPSSASSPPKKYVYIYCGQSVRLPKMYWALWFHSCTKAQRGGLLHSSFLNQQIHILCFDMCMQQLLLSPCPMSISKLEIDSFEKLAQFCEPHEPLCVSTDHKKTQ